MINWDDCTPLTRKEFDSFIESAIPFLKSMEDKNGWDFFVNEISIKTFCSEFIYKAFESNDYKDYQKHYPKVKDMLTIRSILMESDWTKEDETLRNNKGCEIWKLIINKVNTIVDIVL